VTRAETTERVRRQCLAAGMDPDEPLALLLLALAEDREDVRQLAAEVARASGQRGLSPEAERDFVARASRDIASETRREIVDLARSIKVSAWFYSVIALVVMAAGMLAGGYYWGHRAGVAEVHETEAGLREAFAGGSASARMWLSWMQENQFPLRCAKLHQESGHQACDISLWMDPPQQPARLTP
jgi:hypothetical protein